MIPELDDNGNVQGTGCIMALVVSGLSLLLVGAICTLAVIVI